MNDIEVKYLKLIGRAIGNSDNHSFPTYEKFMAIQNLDKGDKIEVYWFWNYFTCTVSNVTCDNIVVTIDDIRHCHKKEGINNPDLWESKIGKKHSFYIKLLGRERVKRIWQDEVISNESIKKQIVEKF